MGTTEENLEKPLLSLPSPHPKEMQSITLIFSCYAWLGHVGGKQPLNLGNGCGHKGTIIHEMLHTLGFAHEQARNDRDRYIRVNWENIHKSSCRCSKIARV